MVSFPGYDDVIKRILEHGQAHVFKYWDSLSTDEKRTLLHDLNEIDFDLLDRLYGSVNDRHEMNFGPAPFIRVPVTPEEKAMRAKARETGVHCIRQGKVAAFIVAGGQGSRLGYEGPKGKFSVGPVSDSTLFRIHAEKILKYSRKYGVVIPWLVMTSEVNHDETVAYFREMNYFGLRESDVIIFPQNMIPSLDTEGKLVLPGPGVIFRNPDGHGGSLTALRTSGALEEMRRRGIEIISYFQVDNPLIRIIDPEFIGYHVMRGAAISSKALKKAYPEEKVGVFAVFSNGRLGVVEYSDLPEEKANERDSSGELLYSAGSIAIHLFSVDFIDSVTSGGELELPFHTARKKLGSYSDGSVRDIDGFKFEKFVFDALPLTEHNIVMEIPREEEFAPVKNATGVDSVESCRKLMLDLHRKWLEERGIVIPPEVKELEISPLLAVEPGDIPSDIVIPGKERVYLEA
jgi:UDP-N-acetylglucosamine/UDP-N-acetylgalactosamine diphosphorylase